MKHILETIDLTKSYPNGNTQLTVLDSVNIKVPAGSTASIVGPSGSGKTTLLGLCAGLDRASSGSVILDGKDITHFSEGERAELRRKSIGFIFQNFQLMPNLTAIENYPKQLSGGEQQRVAIARAFIHQPKVLFADEPTGNLDEESSILIEDMLFEINKELGTTLVIVTHDNELAEKTER